MQSVSDPHSPPGGGLRVFSRFLWLAPLTLALLISVLVLRGFGTEQEPVKPAGIGAGRVTTADPARAAALMRRGDLQVIDVRTPAEFARGHLPGATNIDFKAGDFSDRLARLDPNGTYLLHCATGGRSTRSLAVFERLNFTSIIHMDEGIKAWQSAGYQVEE